jgi:hypothetical protein
VLAKSNGNLFAITFKTTSIAIAIVGRAITLFLPTVRLTYLDYYIEEHGSLDLGLNFSDLRGTGVSLILTPT